ncbi:hypothetical protein NIES4073_51160 [Kalymmatonema gypsitolerans NIES-4073]|nr:hypothetical protein NIES4073_51160 [Scytonema sp. NIES-4073]
MSLIDAPNITPEKVVSMLKTDSPEGLNPNFARIIVFRK